MFNLFGDTLLKAAQTDMSRQDLRKLEAQLENIDVDTANKRIIGIMLGNAEDISSIVTKFLAESAQGVYDIMEFLNHESLDMREAFLNSSFLNSESVDYLREINNLIGGGLRKFLDWPAFNP